SPGKRRRGFALPAVSCTSPPLLIFKPPKLKVTPQVTPYASNGGSSMVLAQFDLLMFRPVVQRPSLTAMLNGTSLRTALLYSRISRRHASAFTPSIFFT